MLLVKTFLKEHPKKGICLIAGEQIKADQIIYRDEPEFFDRIISGVIIRSLPKIMQEWFVKYSSYSEKDDSYFLCCDNMRFVNHSSKPNCKYYDETKEIKTLRDVSEGEELTTDYNEFCDLYRKEPDFIIVED